ncbi:MAG: hypothetical protein AB1758_03910 [Candidatus Eremiobacterota bacterium]
MSQSNRTTSRLSSSKSLLHLFLDALWVTLGSLLWLLARGFRSLVRRRRVRRGGAR